MTTKKYTGKGEHMREKMVAITARILREQGFKAATVRTIAQEANVNIAAVRYYFGSKEELIGAALEYMMSSLENVVAVLDDSRLTPRERMKKYILGYFALARRHPALFRSISAPSSSEARETYFIYLNLLHDQSWEKVIENMAAITGYTDRRDLELKCMQIFSAVEFPIILESNKKNTFLTHYTDPATMERYVDILLDDTAKPQEKNNDYLKEILNGAK